MKNSFNANTGITSRNYNQNYLSAEHFEFAKKKYEDAVLCHEKAVKIEPESVVAHYNFGNTLYHAGQFEEAKKIYQKTIALDPLFNRAHSNLGSLDLLNQNFVEGFSAYHLRIFNDPLLKKIILKIILKVFQIKKKLH